MIFTGFTMFRPLKLNWIVPTDSTLGATASMYFPGGEFRMQYDAQVSYERRLVAITGDPVAVKLAADYVDQLRPCYEWEGFHDCPEREALFADEYQAAHPDGPFHEYLTLLSAHRWLCTAEAFDYEKRPADSSRSHQLYEERVARARQSPSLLIRSAADRLSARNRCY